MGDCEIGVVGLGVMGQNFLLNIVEHGFRAAGYDKSPAKVDALTQAASGMNVTACRSPEQLVDALERPRAIVLLVPAGSVVDSVLKDLLAHLQEGDIVIDGGNSFFEDTDLRSRALGRHGVQYIGMGISGGQYGARHGPCLMPGGPREAYDRIGHILEAVAAQVDGEPCVTHVGPQSSGHYVKMVHNGIEYGVMELIAETYDLLHTALGMECNQLAEIYTAWNSRLPSYLLEITGDIFRQRDPDTGKCLVDVISDVAREKGTGMWASQNAMDLKVPVPNIDMGVTMRNLSMHEGQRLAISRTLHGPLPHLAGGKREDFVARIERALQCGMRLTFAQGFHLLHAASQEYGWGLQLGDIARIWRGGCIIRSSILEEIRQAFERNAEQVHLLEDIEYAALVQEGQDDLRRVATTAMAIGLPGTGLAGAIGYVDAMRTAHLPTNLIQAQRDLFGAHTYERVDRKGVFHTEWMYQPEEAKR